MSGNSKKGVLWVGIAIVVVGGAVAWFVGSHEPEDRSGTDEFVQSVGKSLDEATGKGASKKITSLEGIYSNRHGSLEFKEEGKVYYHEGGNVIAAKYVLDGDKVLVTTGNNVTMVYTRDGDTLTMGPTVMRKR